MSGNHDHWHDSRDVPGVHDHMIAPRPFHHMHPHDGEDHHLHSPHLKVMHSHEGVTSIMDLDKLASCIAANPERGIVLAWIIEEWFHYANQKWGFAGDHGPDDHEEWMQNRGYQKDSEWRRQILQYFDRAAAFSVGETDDIRMDHVLAVKGRQAAMKTATTLIDSLACMIRNFGLPPAPGQTSGDVELWNAGGTPGNLVANASFEDGAETWTGQGDGSGGSVADQDTTLSTDL